MPKKQVSVVHTQAEGGSDTETRYTDRAPLGEPAAIDATAPAAAYLKSVESLLQPAWASFLEDCRVRLPASHDLNDDSLVSQIEITMDPEGQVVEVAIAGTSGNLEFDQVAKEIVGDLTELPTPPAQWVSDDDRVHLSWSFARDRRQAGAATASLRRLELPLVTALPRLLAAGQIASAAQRILIEGQKGGTVPPSLMTAVVGRVVELALLEEDPMVVATALDAIAGGKLTAFAPQARAALLSTNIEVASSAARALGVVGGEADSEVLGALARGQNAASTVLSVAAAEGLVSLGKGAQVRKAALADLTGKNPEARLAGLAVLASLEDTGAVAALGRILGGAQKSTRDERVAAAKALGKQAAKSPAALKSLLAGSGTSDAAVRESCVAAIASAARAGLQSRMAYWKVVELIRNKDERVRAAAIQAAAYLEPERFAKELAGIKAGGSQLVVLSIAAVLADIPGEVALGRLLDLASVRNVGMRTAAAHGLAKRQSEKATSALQVLLTDESPVVRKAALTALTSEQELTPFLSDDSQSVQAAALSGIVRSLGTDKSTKIVATKLAASASDRGLQMLWVRSWLAHE